LLGLYEDTGNLAFPSTKAEDAHAAAHLLENGGDLHIIDAFLSPTYGLNQKDVLFRMLHNPERIAINGYTVSINRVRVRGYVSDLAVVVQMYRRILNVDAAFGVFSLDGDRCLVIGRSRSEGIDIGAIMRHMGGGGHPGAGSVMLKSADPAGLEAWIRVLVGERHRSAKKIRDLMSFPVVTVDSETTMRQAGELLRQKGCKGAPVVHDDKIVGMLSRRDFQKIKKKSQIEGPVRAFMSPHVVTISPRESPGHAAHLMIKHDIGRLPVIEDGKIVGIFSRSDAVANFYGLCPLGSSFSMGCHQNRFSFCE
jgi:CBS domain-containing protein